MVDVPKDGGLEKYDASQNVDIIEGEFEEITEPEASSAEPEIEAEPVTSKPETKKPEEKIEEAEFEDVAPPEQEEDVAMKAHIKAEVERKQKQKLQEELDAIAKKQNQAQAQKSEPQQQEPQKSNLTAQEQKFLKERVLGRENAVDGSESKIHLANGKQILETTVKIKGEERDFVGYKSRFRKMDEESALAIVLTAKENGWDSIEVHGSKRSKEMLARVATEHGLDVGNYQLPEVETPKQEAPTQETPKESVNSISGTYTKQEALKQEAPKQEAPKQEEPKQMVVSNLSGFTKAPVKITSNFAQIGVDDKKPALPAPKDGTPKLSGPEGKPSLPPPEEPKALPPPPPKTGMGSP